MRKLLTTALVGALLIGAAACSGDQPAPRAGSSATPKPKPSSPAPPPDITLEFAGDVHFAGRTLKLLDEPDTAFGPIADTLSGADVTVANLETSVTERGTPEPKQFHFRAPASAYQAVKAAGIDVVSLANNHAMDYGRDGLDDTTPTPRTPPGSPPSKASRSPSSG